MSDQRTNKRKRTARVGGGHGSQSIAGRHQRVTLGQLERLPADVEKQVIAALRAAFAWVEAMSDRSMEEDVAMQEQAAKARRAWKGRPPSEISDAELLARFDALHDWKRAYGNRPMGLGAKYQRIATEASAKSVAGIGPAQVAARLRVLRRARGDLA